MSKRILVVDDDVGVVKLLEKNLSANGYEVTGVCMTILETSFVLQASIVV